MKVFEFLYNSCTWESAPATLSIHKTREGAEKALNKHKEEERTKFEKYKENSIESLKQYSIEENLNEEQLKSLINSIGKFDDSKSWDIVETELLD